ncbi:alpha/beta-hydrolase [Aspergillus sclerotioniger CBS 115572]|uniref:Alpha/beta-hydrolase n=1 Tax=Aspergillus sclerotioniger CBS 115572 TaxID=1450535 RepID=A0A317W5E8_9EURO|nr:alpha/beta-hydrolase [Aspergillus sclerotioniger CBS 115572]PWY80821.1 alpha/beta-hydrolase [Aspergillus sclerotioniger CBS 115572]
MTFPKNGLVIGAITVAVAFLATYLVPFTDIFLEKAVELGVTLPKGFVPPPIVHDTGRDIKYIGSLSNEVEHFQNIFYAEEPTGSRRFAPPVPVQPPAGTVIDATSPGAWCPQGTGDILPFTSRVSNISENCLSLRIARPTGLKDERLPVVVWLHGGGHALGSASEVLYNPEGLVKEAVVAGKPLIYVAINYRLGLFGFATSEAMVENKQTNAGLRDQRAALEWVRDNIEAFGGDPDRVTAIGQSVGASDIGLHLTSWSGTKGVPFQQAIMMSGAPGLNFNSDPALVADNTASVAKEVGCVTKDAQSLETLDCIRRIPFETLTNISVTASRAARPPFGEGFFYPTIDGDILPGRPTELLRAGKFVKDVPIIASWVTNDGAWYAPPPTSTDEEVLGSFGLWLSKLSPLTKEKLLDLYPVAAFEHMAGEGPISPQYYRAAQLNRDIWFSCPVLDFTWQYVQKGGVDASKVWLYEHNATRYAPVFEMMGVPMWRVAHLSDIPYVMNNGNVGGGADNSPEQMELSQLVSRRVIGFAHDGRPGEEWPAAFLGGSEELPKESPGRVSIQVFGGPVPGPVTVRKDASDATAAEQAVLWEKLFDRCEFINSVQMRAEAGV